MFFLVAFGLSATATASSIIYHTANPDNTSPLTGWTTDTKSGLQWLDVTDTAGLTYAQVESNPLYSGWSYATNTQLNQLLIDATNITIMPSQHIQYGYNNGTAYFTYLQGGSNITASNQNVTFSTNNPSGVTFTHLFDPLINMLGSTLDLYTKETTGYPTYDAYFQTTGTAPYYLYQHNTFTDGLLAPNAGQYEIGHIQSNALVLAYTGYYGEHGVGDYAYYYTLTPTGLNPGVLYGSFLVRDSATIATPIPAAIWLVSSALAGLVGFAGRKPT